jgi:hypothetical protein
VQWPAAAALQSSPTASGMCCGCTRQAQHGLVSLSPTARPPQPTTTFGRLGKHTVVLVLLVLLPVVLLVLVVSAVRELQELY